MSSTSEQFIYNEELYQLPARVIILIPMPWNELSDGEKALLAKILSAARLSLQGVQILQDTTVAIESLKVYNPAVVISFGVALTPPTDLYEPKKIDGITIIRSDKLDALDDTKKKDLWAALKKLISA
jgi:hypothetical protein